MDFLCTVDANHRQRSFRKAALRNSLENAENLSVEKGALLRPVSEKLSYFNRLNDVGKNKITRYKTEFFGNYEAIFFRIVHIG